MGTVLIYKNSPAEGPGLLADLLDLRGVPYTVAERARGQPLDPRGFDAVVVLGGPQSANDRDTTTRRLLASIRGVVVSRKPCLGICLGAQMLARALGAPVVKSPAPEYGCDIVHLEAAACRDPLFRGFPARLPVFQWHGETFGIPRSGVRLATGRECVNQAFRVGRAWGVQFHTEATPTLIGRWAVLGREELKREGVEPAALVRGYEKRARAIAGAGERMVENLLDVAGLR